MLVVVKKLKGESITCFVLVIFLSPKATDKGYHGWVCLESLDGKNTSLHSQDLHLSIVLLTLISCISKN